MEVFVARQPIFDKHQNVCAYELLFRSGLNNSYDHPDGDYATSSVLTNNFLLIGTEKLTRGKRAFINFTRNLLLNEVATIFSKELLAIEILETVEPDEQIVAVCKKLKRSGYPLVLDDFYYKPEYEPLIELADIIKIDFMNTTVEERRSIVRRIGTRRTELLAEKVETQETYNQALEMGFSYFQGYFFCKPVMISSHEVPSYKFNHLLLLREIHQPDVDFNRLEKIFKQDVALSYKLLRYINSAFFGLPNKIRSIKHALALLGTNEIKKWLSLIALSSMGKDKSQELLIISLIRAKFCESVAPKVGLKERSSELFLVGLFSLIDAFLDRPISDVLAKLPLSEEVKQTLLGEENPLRDVFELVLALEKGNWNILAEYVIALNLPEKDLPEQYQEAIEWAYQSLPD